MLPEIPLDNESQEHHDLTDSGDIFNDATRVQVQYHQGDQLYFAPGVSIKKISANKYGEYFGYALAVDGNGELYGWGLDQFGQLNSLPINEEICNSNASYMSFVKANLNDPLEDHIQCHYHSQTKIPMPKGVVLAH